MEVVWCGGSVVWEVCVGGGVEGSVVWEVCVGGGVKVVWCGR